MLRRRHFRCAAGVLVAGLASTALVGPGPASARTSGSGRTFERLATFPVYRNSPDPTTETVAEITAASTDGRTLISTDSPGERVTFTDISNPRRPQPAGALAVGGEPTSVAVYRSYALIAVNTSSELHRPERGSPGRLADRTARRWRASTLGGQPDSVAISPAGARGGSYAAIAIENERDEEVNDGEIPQLPGGFVVVRAAERRPGGLAGHADQPDSEPDRRSGIVAPEDPEPEYVTINQRNQVAVTLQENNGIAIIDLQTSKVLRAFTAGTVDLTGIDTVEDGRIDLTGSQADVAREPDGIGWIGNGLLATANEGDLAGGSRGWSIFDATTGSVVWDAGNTLERIAIVGRPVSGEPVGEQGHRAGEHHGGNDRRPPVRLRRARSAATSSRSTTCAILARPSSARCCR